MKLQVKRNKLEVNVEADAKSIIEKKMDLKSKKKTRYQIRQEEKRKNAELQYELDTKKTKWTFIAIGAVFIFCIGILILGGIFGWL